MWRTLHSLLHNKNTSVPSWLPKSWLPRAKNLSWYTWSTPMDQYQKKRTSHKETNMNPKLSITFHFHPLTKSNIVLQHSTATATSSAKKGCIIRDEPVDTTTWLLITSRSAKKTVLQNKDGSRCPKTTSNNYMLYSSLNDLHSWNLPHTHIVWVQVSNSTLSDDKTTPPLNNLWKCCTSISLCHHLRQGKHSDPTPAS